MSKTARESFYSIPNLSSDRLLNKNDVSSFRHRFSSSIFYLRRFSIGFFTLIFATLCCQTIYQLKVEQLKSFRQLNNFSVSQPPKICSLFETKLNFYFKIPANYVSLGFLAFLLVLLIFVENFSFRNQRSFKTFWQRFTFPMIFNSHSHIYRFQSAAVFGLIALEILHIFDEFLIHSHRHFQHGPLLDLIVQIGLGLMLGFRYFPILSIFEKENFLENRIENSFVYGFASVYLYTEILFKLQSDVNCALDQTKINLIKETFEKFQRLGVDLRESLTNQSFEDDDELKQLKYSLELDRQSIFYNVLRNAPFYYFIVYLSVCLTFFFFETIAGRTRRSSNYKNLARWKYVKENLFRREKRSNSTEFSRLFRFFNALISFFKRNFYEIRPFFRYSKLIICIYTSAATLIYYFTFWIQDHTYIVTKKFLLFLNLILCALADLSKDLCYNLNFHHINRDVQLICYLTATITCAQLFAGLRHYQMQMCRAYRGVFDDIPLMKHFSSVSIVSKSIHYPGRFIGKSRNEKTRFFKIHTFDSFRFVGLQLRISFSHRFVVLHSFSIHFLFFNHFRIHFETRLANVNFLSFSTSFRSFTL
jgi:hypothetical protein